MNRTRTVSFVACAMIVGLVCATHITLFTKWTQALSVAGFTASGFVALSFAIRRTRVRNFGRMSLVVCLAGCLAYIYGDWMEMRCPNHPVSSLGQREMVYATVTKIEQRATGDVVILNVDGEGQPVKRCAFPALWFTRSGWAASLRVGSQVQLSGILIRTPPGPSAAQDWLNPMWEVRGKLQSIHLPVRFSRFDGHLRSVLTGTVANQEAALVDVALSMVIGHAAPISPSMQNLFLEAGVTHLLAASGANVVIFMRLVASLWTRLLSAIRVHVKWLEALCLFASILGFMYVCGFSAPIVRASLFSAYGICGRLLGRHVAAGTAMSAVCIVFILSQPYQFTTVSALFSLVATYAMHMAVSTWELKQVGGGHRHDDGFGQHLGLHRKLWTRLCIVLRHIGQVFYISLMIDLTMLPLVWWWFGQLTPYGAIGTVAAEPFVIILLPLTILWAMLGMLGAYLNAPFFGCAMLIGLVVTTIVSWLLDVLRWISAMPGSLIKMPGLPIWLVVLYFVALVVWLKWQPKMSFFRQERKSRVV